MNFFEVAVLALVQGLTEFLPISSTGHLLLARLLFGFSDIEGNAFDAFLHLGTWMAVMIYFRGVWWKMARSFFGAFDPERRRLARQLAVATVPAVLAGYMGKDVFETYFRTPQAIAISFLVTAAFLLLADKGAKYVRSLRELTFMDAFLVGVAQVLALVPAISRSGATIAAARMRGLARLEAATFSFLLSAPIIFGAGILSLGDLLKKGIFAPQYLAAGFIVSFVAGLAAIHGMLKLVERTSFTPFVVYLVLAAIIIWYVG